MTLARIRRVPPPQAEHPQTRWDVYRDEQGNPVTITEQQMHAIWHALHVVDEVRRSQGVNVLSEGAGFLTNAYKSRLLGWMLLNGEAPFDEPPPFSWGARDYSWDGTYGFQAVKTE